MSKHIKLVIAGVTVALAASLGAAAPATAAPAQGHATMKPFYGWCC